MSENDKIPVSDDYGKIKSPFLTKVENFFYHYKWHTIAVIFIIFTVTICTLQMCKKQSFDIHILYAGGTSVSMTAGEGEAESHRSELINASKRFTSDFDSDGTKNIDFSTLYIPTSEQLEEIEAAAGGDISVNYTLIMENKESFNQYMIYGDYYIVLMSKSLCEELISRGNSNPLAEVSYYLPENYSEKGYRLLGEYGVYLNSTPLYDNPGFSKLGEDTVLCIRRYSEISNKESKEFHTRSEEIFRLMLEDKSAAD